MSGRDEDRVRSIALEIERNPRSIGVRSTGEMCWMGLLFNRADFLPDGYTFLDAVKRLDARELEAVINVSRDGTWRAPELEAER